MATLDLNELRRTLLDNAERGQTHPNEPSRKVVVDRDGKIMRADDAGLLDQQELSEVPQEVFAGPLNALRTILGRSGSAGKRLERDRGIVRAKLPWGTTEVSVDGMTGFVYEITDEFSQPYTMVAYFDGTEYQVKVVAPEIETQHGVMAAHVFSDGRLCLRPPAGGMPSLAEAYAKSVLWANGFTIFRQTGKFPWPSH